MNEKESSTNSGNPGDGGTQDGQKDTAPEKVPDKLNMPFDGNIIDQLEIDVSAKEAPGDGEGKTDEEGGKAEGDKGGSTEDSPRLKEAQDKIRLQAEAQKISEQQIKALTDTVQKFQDGSTKTQTEVFEKLLEKMRTDGQPKPPSMDEAIKTFDANIDDDPKRAMDAYIKAHLGDFAKSLPTPDGSANKVIADRLGAIEESNKQLPAMMLNIMSQMSLQSVKSAVPNFAENLDGFEKYLREYGMADNALQQLSLNRPLMDKFYGDFLVSRKGKSVTAHEKEQAEAAMAEKLLQNAGGGGAGPDGGGEHKLEVDGLEPGMNEIFR